MMSGERSNFTGRQFRARWFLLENGRGHLVLEGKPSRFFFFFSLYRGPFLKTLLIFLQYYFCFMFWFFGHEVCGLLHGP